MATPSSSSPSLITLSVWQRCVRYWVLKPRIDICLVLPVAGWLVIAHYSVHRLMVTSLPPEVRRSLWVALLGTSGTVIALMLTSVSILINLIRTPMSDLDKLLRTSQKRQIGQTILAGMPSLGGLFVAALVTAVTDGRTTVGSWPVEAAVAFALAASVSHIARVIWIIRKLLLVSG